VDKIRLEELQKRQAAQAIVDAERSADRFLVNYCKRKLELLSACEEFLTSLTQINSLWWFIE